MHLGLSQSDSDVRNWDWQRKRCDHVGVKYDPAPHRALLDARRKSKPCSFWYNCSGGTALVPWKKSCSVAASWLFLSIFALQCVYLSQSQRFWILSILIIFARGSVWWTRDTSLWHSLLSIQTGWVVIISVCASHSVGTGIWKNSEKRKQLLYCHAWSWLT